MDAVLRSLIVTQPDGVTVTYTPKVGPPVPGPGLPEAPEDGSTYGRENGAWVVIEGTGGALVRTKVAVGTISIHKAVRDVPGGIAYLDATDLATIGSPLGVSIQSATDGGSVQVVVDGDVVEPSWSWTPDQPIFVGAAGALTQTPPDVASAAFYLAVGYALTATSMRVCFGPAIKL